MWQSLLSQHSEADAAAFAQTYAGRQLYVAYELQVEDGEVNTLIVFLIRFCKFRYGAENLFFCMIIYPFQEGQYIADQDILKERQLVCQSQHRVVFLEILVGKRYIFFNAVQFWLHFRYGAVSLHVAVVDMECDNLSSYFQTTGEFARQLHNAC